MIREIVLLPSHPNGDSAKGRPDPLWVLSQVAWRVAQKRVAARKLEAMKHKKATGANMTKGETNLRHGEGA
jgi:hypothetical protein